MKQPAPRMPLFSRRLFDLTLAVLVFASVILLAPAGREGESILAAQVGPVGPAPLNTGGPELVKPGEVIVQVETGGQPQGQRGKLQGAMLAAGLVGRQVRPLLDPDFFVVTVTRGEERIASANLDEQPGIVQASPNYVRYIQTTPNDSNYPLQWNLPTINVPRAWDTPQGTSVVVAVLDTGVDMTHPELRDRIVPGYDFVNDDDDATDDQGHGTHVAGIIAAAANNGQGVAGIAWRAAIMPIKVADERGRIYSDAWINGLTFARQNGAKVANMSFGGVNPSQAEQSAVSKAWNAGVVVVAAAGNCGAGSAGCQTTNPILYPAAYDNAISVGAVGDNLRRAYYSEFNRQVDLVAPGGDARFANDSPNHWILSTYPTAMNANFARGFGLNIGTSMAAPHVAAIAALMFSSSPGWTNAGVEQRLKETAIDLGPAGRDDEYGFGLANAAAAVARGPGAAATPTAALAAATSTPAREPTRPPAVATNPPTRVPATATSPPATATTVPATATATATAQGQLPVPFGCVFADVCQGDWFYPYVSNLLRDGVVSGYADNSFRPGEAITRGELAKMLVLATGRAPFDAPNPHFGDVPRGSAFYPYVESIYAADIISGYRDGSFRPAAVVNRGQLIKMVSLAKNWPLRAPMRATFRDVPPGSAYFAYAETANLRGLVTPDAAGSFRPFEPASRAETARIVDQARR